MKNISNRVTLLRIEKGLSLSRLAEVAGISKGLLHRIEKGENKNPEIETLRKIARGLDSTLGHLLGNEIVQNVRELPDVWPEWLTQLVKKLRSEGKEPDEDLLEALYVLQNRKGPVCDEEDWHYLYTTLERSLRPPGRQE